MYDAYKKYRKLSYQKRLSIYESEKTYISAHAQSAKEYETKIRALVNALNI